MSRPTKSVVREMLDREAIRDLPVRYCHYVWTNDVDGMMGLFTEDGLLSTASDADDEVREIAGAEALRALGFRRVTLARELTLDEIRSISASCGIETEVFIHGALCYCYSGLCLYSSQLRGRSGNRGRCAYPCRDLFTVTQPAAALTPSPAAAGFAFSMKDLALPEQIAALRAAGVRRRSS